ncbi:helix-turn-helix domain-containing protein [Paenibacillaceae bacterium WGS1546]|uniref:AraC family transcriptional regulator n=1 Tax=Cohnella sp. WGS1546 TaxID=3366810 RepID=UPI00372D2B0B
MEALQDLTDVGLLEDPEGRVPFECYEQIISWVANESAAQSSFFLDLGTSFLTIPPVIQHLIRHTATFYEKIHQVLRYSKLMCDYFDFGLRENEDSYELSFTFGGPSEVSASIIEAVTTHMYCGLKSTWNDFEAEQVAFSYCKPAYADQYKRYFYCPISFGSTENKIVFSRTYIDHSDSSVNDRYLYRLLKERADVLMGQVENSHSMITQVKSILMESLPTGKASIIDTAKKLHMSRQTLYRNLQKENTTYRQVLAECQRKLSANYIEQSDLSLESIAFLLGYSEVSVFQKAFRRWYGISPGEYRRQHTMR